MFLGWRQHCPFVQPLKDVGAVIVLLFFERKNLHNVVAAIKYILFIIIWDSVQLNHPYGTFSKFPEQANEK